MSAWLQPIRAQRPAERWFVALGERRHLDAAWVESLVG